MRLHDLVSAQAGRAPAALAVRAPDGALSYGALDRAANRAARALAALGVGPGDRVGLWTGKSLRTVVAMQAVLRLGAAYVPLDRLSAPARVGAALGTCGVRVLVGDAAQADALRGHGPDDLTLLPADRPADFSDDPLPPPPGTDTDLAYVLCTSGSTGAPKCVCLSHRNALAFVTWAAAELAATDRDRFANHAPFHFDLSVLDLYAAFLVGGSVHLVPEDLTYAPARLVEFIAGERISVWYSVPSALMLMAEQGGLLDAALPELRAVLFAGEPYPVKHLRALWARLGRQARFLNLYGPTETNVCTFYEVRSLDEGATRPVPIGRACSGDRVWARKADGGTAGPEEEGELMVAGPTVFLGYWGQPPHGDGPYATGDRVRLRADGDYEFLGRADTMIKVRGHRIDLGEVEAALAAHPHVADVAVVAAGDDLDRRLVAFLVAADGITPSLLTLKQHCAARLARYMIIDAAVSLPALPRTRNGKVDRTELARRAAAGPARVPQE